MARICMLALAALLVALPGAGRATAAVELTSHRAAYRLSVVDCSQGSSVVRVDGGLVIEWQAACDGWISNQRLAFTAATDEGPGFRYDVRFSSWESRDGDMLRFNTRSSDGTGPAETYKGSATLGKAGAAGVARFAEPRDDRVELPPATIFPSRQMRDLIAAAMAGRPMLTTIVFDGSGLDALSQVTAAIGKPRKVETDGKTQTRWPVSLAYFKEGSTDVLPDFELAFDLSPGGIIYRVVMDYGDFTLRADLEKLELLPPPRCD
jgi:hypothetical protein